MNFDEEHTTTDAQLREYAEVRARYRATTVYRLDPRDRMWPVLPANALATITGPDAEGAYYLTVESNR